MAAEMIGWPLLLKAHAIMKGQLQSLAENQSARVLYQSMSVSLNPGGSMRDPPHPQYWEVEHGDPVNSCRRMANKK